MRNLIILSVVILSFFIIVDKGFSAEDITISTYYPSPYGVYSTLRLYPNASAPTACDANTRGTMYYNNNDTTAYMCRETPSGSGTYSWVDIAPYCEDAEAHILTPGTYSIEVPCGCNTVTVALYAAGGGGGGAYKGQVPPVPSYNNGGDGGNGGVFAGVLEVTPGDIHTVTVGVGGNGGRHGIWVHGVGGYSPLPGDAGGDSSFGSLATAYGGGGGLAGSITYGWWSTADPGADGTTSSVFPGEETIGDTGTFDGGAGGQTSLTLYPENGERGDDGSVVYRFGAY